MQEDFRKEKKKWRKRKREMGSPEYVILLISLQTLEASSFLNNVIDLQLFIYSSRINT